MDLTIKTDKKQQIVDITNQVQELVKPESGAVNIYTAHTTCAITTADLDPGTDLDILDAIKEMIPKLDYRHPHDPSHVWTHIASAIIGPSVTVPVRDSKLVLGTWQRIVLIELEGPRERNLVLTNLKTV